MSDYSHGILYINDADFARPEVQTMLDIHFELEEQIIPTAGGYVGLAESMVSRYGELEDGVKDGLAELGVTDYYTFLDDPGAMLSRYGTSDEPYGGWMFLDGEALIVENDLRRLLKDCISAGTFGPLIALLADIDATKAKL